jgi:hypothetical protein
VVRYGIRLTSTFVRIGEDARPASWSASDAGLGTDLGRERAKEARIRSVVAPLRTGDTVHIVTHTPAGVSRV